MALYSKKGEMSKGLFSEYRGKAPKGMAIPYKLLVIGKGVKRGGRLMSRNSDSL
jgi:hypothetical protein